MIINLTKEQIKDVFGELWYMGADNCYKYDKESRKRTDEVEALKLHRGRDVYKRQVIGLTRTISVNY